jgi:hypothetical protein
METSYQPSVRPHQTSPRDPSQASPIMMMVSRSFNTILGTIIDMPPYFIAGRMITVHLITDQGTIVIFYHIKDIKHPQCLENDVLTQSIYLLIIFDQHIIFLFQHNNINPQEILIVLLSPRSPFFTCAPPCPIFSPNTYYCLNKKTQSVFIIHHSSDSLTESALSSRLGWTLSGNSP